MEETVKTYTVEEAKRRMERYCAYQERCHKEVVAKLRQMRMIPEAIDVIVGYLIEENYEEVFEALAEKKANTITEKNIQKARRKLADYLLYKGWESSMVYTKAVELFPYDR